MFAKPVIGISADGPSVRAIGAAVHDPLLPVWLKCISRAGGVPVVVPRLDDAMDQRRVLDHLDGFVLAGQRDLALPETEPAAGGGPCFELALVCRIAERRLPFVGVGVGMQALNVAFGGTLLALKGSLGGQYHVHPHHPCHTLLTRPGSILAHAWDRCAEPVRSVHRLAVGEVAVGFVATGFSNDGIVEAIERNGSDWFAVGVQFCPDPAGGLAMEMTLFESLVEESMVREATPACPGRDVLVKSES